MIVKSFNPFPAEGRKEEKKNLFPEFELHISISRIRRKQHTLSSFSKESARSGNHRPIGSGYCSKPSSPTCCNLLPSVTFGILPIAGCSVCIPLNILAPCNCVVPFDCFSINITLPLYNQTIKPSYIHIHPTKPKFLQQNPPNS